jgi:hypothetical protein
MAAVGETGVYKAPTDVQAGDPQILARVGAGTESAALVTGVSEDGLAVNLRVFPDQQTEFSIRGLTVTEDPVKGAFGPVATAPIGLSARSTSKAPTPTPVPNARRP